MRAKDIIPEKPSKREARLIAEIDRLRALKAPKKITIRQGKATKHTIRLVIPDSHGEHIDPAVEAAVLSDAALLQPSHVVWLGDHIDCGGVFSVHQRSHTKEMVESYDADVAAANRLLDGMQQAAPNARHDYLFGNHEDHIERWASREFDSHRDAEFVLERIGPAAVLHLKARGFRWFKSSEMYDGLSSYGVIKRGKCHFVHGMSHSKHAANVHLERAGANIVFGHVHRVMNVGQRTLTSDGFGAWCPGTLSKLQRLYQHTLPSSWQHGYGVQFVNEGTGTFVHFNVPIVRGVSLMRNVVEAVR